MKGFSLLTITNLLNFKNKKIRLIFIMVMSYSHPRYPTSDWNIYGTKRSLKTSSVWFLSIFYATKLTFLGLATSSNKGRKILCLSFLCSSTPIMTHILSFSFSFFVLLFVFSLLFSILCFVNQ